MPTWQEQLATAKAALQRSEALRARIDAELQADQDQATAQGYEERYATPGRRAMSNVSEFVKGGKTGVPLALTIASLIPGARLPVKLAQGAIRAFPAASKASQAVQALRAVGTPARAVLGATSVADMPAAALEGDPGRLAWDAFGASIIPGASKALGGLKKLLPAGGGAATTAGELGDVVRGAEMYADSGARTVTPAAGGPSTWETPNQALEALRNLVSESNVTAKATKSAKAAKTAAAPKTVVEVPAKNSEFGFGDDISELMPSDAEYAARNARIAAITERQAPWATPLAQLARRVKR